MKRLILIPLLFLSQNLFSATRNVVPRNNDEGTIGENSKKWNGVIATTGIFTNITVQESTIVKITAGDIYISNSIGAGSLLANVSQLGTPTHNFRTGLLTLPSAFGTYPLLIARADGEPLGNLGAFAPACVVTAYGGLDNQTPKFVFFDTNTYDVIVMQSSHDVTYTGSNYLDIQNTVQINYGRDLVMNGAYGTIYQYSNGNDHSTGYTRIYNDGNYGHINVTSGQDLLLENGVDTVYLTDVRHNIDGYNLYRTTAESLIDQTNVTISSGFVSGNSTFSTVNVGTLIFGDGTTMNTKATGGGGGGGVETTTVTVHLYSGGDIYGSSGTFADSLTSAWTISKSTMHIVDYQLFATYYSTVSFSRFQLVKSTGEYDGKFTGIGESTIAIQNATSLATSSRVVPNTLIIYPYQKIALQAIEIPTSGTMTSNVEALIDVWYEPRNP